jgi:hypothetical protein
MPCSGTAAGSSFDFRPDPFVIAHLPLDARDDDAIVRAADARRRDRGTDNASRSAEQPTARARQILVSGSLSGIADRAISTALTAAQPQEIDADSVGASFASMTDDARMEAR